MQLTFLYLRLREYAIIDNESKFDTRWGGIC